MPRGLHKIAFAKSARHDEEPILRSIEKFLGIRFLDIEVGEASIFVYTNSDQLARLVKEHQQMLRSK